MSFVQVEFFAFFALVLILNWFLKRWPLIWRLFLLFSSYFFYSIWNIYFLLILFLTSLFNFLSGLAISKNFFGARKPIFIFSVIANLSVLGFFKYYDFFRVSAEVFLTKIGLPPTLPFLQIVLPIGLSFYIFRTISYNADVYLGKISPTSSVLDFLIYVAFFPQLLSGPIARAGDFLVQLKDGGAKKINDLYGNFTLIFLGLFKKLVISSYLVVNITDDVFAVPENYSSLVILLSVFAYSLVIYFDFSGYTDLAIGFAGLMGFRSPINFDVPYLSLNIQDFWRRWHITLSSWIRDYVYIPLGGSQKGLMRKYFNLMTAMILVGLWHGAATHFIIWGGLHGMALVGYHLYQDRKKVNFSSKVILKPAKKLRKTISNLFCWFITFNFVSFAWIFFRLETTENAFKFIKTLFVSPKSIEAFQVYIFYVVIIGFLFFLFEKEIVRYLTIFQEKLPIILWFCFAILIIILIFKLSPEVIPTFIYFGF